MSIVDKIKQYIGENKVILFMKGSPKLPQCGFSARAAQCLEACDVDFAYVDILQEPEIRKALPEYSDWPTFPQLFINGELIGGADIIIDLYQQGELKVMLQQDS